MFAALERLPDARSPFAIVSAEAFLHPRLVCESGFEDDSDGEGPTPPPRLSEPPKPQQPVQEHTAHAKVHAHPDQQEQPEKQEQPERMAHAKVNVQKEQPGRTTQADVQQEPQRASKRTRKAPERFKPT